MTGVGAVRKGGVPQIQKSNDVRAMHKSEALSQALSVFMKDDNTHTRPEYHLDNSQIRKNPKA